MCTCHDIPCCNLSLHTPLTCLHSNCLQTLQASGVYLSDIPRYDLSSDYILLAEQRQAEADLKEKYERLSVELQVRSGGAGFLGDITQGLGGSVFAK